MPERDVYDSLYELLEQVPDPRQRRGRRHPLADVLFVLLVAVIAGAEDAQAVEDFAKYHEEWFRDRCGLPSGTPSQDTYLRVLAMMDPAAFGEAFERWVTQLWGVAEGRHRGGRSLRPAGQEQPADAAAAARSVLRGCGSHGASARRPGARDADR